MKPEVVAIIPARYASTRLPGKPLLDIGGKPMVVRVAERARQVASINRIIIATDDQRIFDAVVAAKEELSCLEVMLTSPDHQTGTDRLAEVAAKLDAEIIVNVQGDEPLIEPATIEAAIAPLLADSSIVMSTTSEPIESTADLLNPNVVKVVTDPAGFALYFSRSLIPFPRSAVQAHGSIEAALAARPELLNGYAKHTGMYVYRREFLLNYAKLPPTPLEQSELLEQLRVLEHGYRIKVVKVAHRSIGVDTPEDLERVRRIFRQD
ncbi:MAG: 3-deoxy-manno-octulosonate cytidylyltransferase [Acidobacteriota bacterium]